MTNVRRIFVLVVAAMLMPLWPSVGMAAGVSVVVCASADGMPLEGDSTARDFVGCSNAINTGESAVKLDDEGGRLGSGRIVVDPYRIIKVLDSTSPLWREAFYLNREIEVRIFYWAKSEKGEPTVIWEVEITDGRVQAIEADVSGGIPIEIISIVFGRIIWKDPVNRLEFEYCPACL